VNPVTLGDSPPSAFFTQGGPRGHRSRHAAAGTP